jgi:hypothetical protein
MGKVSIGLRGWRFDEEAVFDENGEFRDLDEMDDDVRARLIRLSGLVTETCDACYLADEAENDAGYVYGEPLAEVVVCGEHEPDFVYWFREAGGDVYAGTDEFDDRFHEWFLEGGRSPAGYGGMDYVDAEPDELPDPPEPGTEYEGQILDTKPEQRIDLVEGTVERFPREDAEYEDPLDDEDDVDLSTEYPS